MKKRFFGAIAITAITLTTIVNLNKEGYNTTVSDLALENVEALAQLEDGTSSNSCQVGGYGCTLFLNYQIVFSSPVHHPSS